ncbi:Ribosomal RNA small subunit methyltransferase E [gut metagenome]|uniref:16S rRNA (uracil(1498)-N(3))-methyltransferase n=1 Tax=gut metagenome TaxID=749906 RepID=J9G9Y6_9ZZZZ
MTLVQALVAPEKLDWIIEKAVETGISEIILTPAARSVTRLAGERLEKRVEKCREIARGAAEQCGRNVVPSITAAKTLAEALEKTEAECRLMLAPGAQQPARLSEGTQKIAFAVGPEGGFSEEEIQLSVDNGWTPVLLGPRILRTETAGLAAAVWINTLLGDYPSL